MDLERYYELRLILQQWRLRLAESIRARIVDTARWLARLHEIYAAEGADEDFTVWFDRWCRQAAIQFILRILFLRVLEDRGLLGATRLRHTDGQRMWAQLTRNLGAAAFIRWCCRDAARLLPDLFDPTEYDLAAPDDELVQRFLDDVWRRPDPDQPGWLRFDFRPLPRGEGDVGFETRFIGDLYQELDAEIRERYALLQTPHFISRFILEHTLLRRFEEQDFHTVTLIDPTCGSGHFLVDAFWMFVERYEAADGVAGNVPGAEDSGLPDADRGPRLTAHGLSSSRRAAIAQTILQTHLFGCDINPYATALARFRLILAACDYAQPTSLRAFRDLRFNLATIDSLIPYENLMVRGVQAGSELARLLGQPEAIQRALPILKHRYDVVVGNPPYILARDPARRELYRAHYTSAYKQFGLSAPFTERFLHLAEEGGYVGLINSNAFARRQFGRKLIEEVLPHYDLQAVIDLSGAYIPGHGTPTVILLARRRPPAGETVLVLSNLKGEPGTPAQPARGEVWQSVLAGMETGSSYIDEYIDLAARPRSLLARHPWQFGGAKSRLYEKIVTNSVGQLDNFANDFGYTLQTNADEVFCLPSDFARRLHVPNEHLRLFALGEPIRDWTISQLEYILFPYLPNLELVTLDDKPEIAQYLTTHKRTLENRVVFGGETYQQVGRSWYAYHQFSSSKHSTDEVVSYAFISTHNHFVIDTTRRLFNRSAPIIQLLGESIGGKCRVLTAILNSSISCFCFKQVCFNKGAGEDPIRDRYEYPSSNVKQVPIPADYETDTSARRRMLILAEEMQALAEQLPALAARKLFELEGEAYHAWNSALEGYVAPHPVLPAPFQNARELRAARERLVALRQDLRARMIFLQEEMDWLAYEMYGLLKSRAPLAEDFLSRAEYEAARLELGQRPFELAGKGYTGDWSPGYAPAPLPEALRALTEARQALIRANPDIALLEDPLYKRRWIPPDADQEFREAAAWWLAEKLEWLLERHGKPLSLAAWADRARRDERILAVLEVLSGTQLFELEDRLLEVIRANAVPNRPEHYLKPSGLRKFYAGQRASPGEHPTPEYARTDFSDATAWRLRGKLNIPRERFIYYAEFDHTPRGVNAPDGGGPWFGWAGWGAPQRADALAFLLDRANRAGWELHYRQCGLRSALRELLPELRAALPQEEALEFEGIAGLCGISFASPCFCQSYRDGFAHGAPAVPGVGEEALGVKIVAAPEPPPSKRGRKPKAESGPEQLALELE